MYILIILIYNITEKLNYKKMHTENILLFNINI